MKNRNIWRLLIFILLIFNVHVQALDSESSELLDRQVCPNLELASANNDGSIRSIACFESYDLAKDAMDKETDDNAIILEKISGKVRVIDAKYALVYMGIKSITVNTNIYSSSSLTNSLVSINTHPNYGATDGAYLGLNYSNKAVKIKIGNVTGWVKNNDYRLIPLAWVKTVGYYSIQSSYIKHFCSKDIEESGYTQTSFVLGPHPEEIKENGIYFSYDGIYFYKDLKTLLSDYRNNNYDNSVNKDSPYYNYYMYLPHRSKTNYTVDDIEVYIRSVLGFKGSIYGKTYKNGYSVLYGQADFYLNSEKMYGANALSVLSLSMNESARGTSSIAINKNNIFGHGAVDGSAYESANGYLDVRSSIYSHGYGFINYGYSEVADWRYRGGNFGNKSTGMNVLYATDPYWGEKAASYYYNFDKDNGLMDYNYYQLAVTNNININVRKEPTTSSKALYAYKYKNIPVIILEEVEGQTVNGSNIWYKVQSDSNLNSDRTSVLGASSSWPHYNWNSYVYVHSSYLTKINNAPKNGTKYNTPSDLDNTPIYDYTYKSYANNTEYTPIVGQSTSNIDYFYSSSLINKKGTLLKNSYVTIVEECKNQNDIRYLVIVDYSTNQKAWISGKNINIVKKDLLGYIPKNNNTALVYDKVSGTQIGIIYTDNYLVILDRILSGDDTWAKVQYSINPIKYGYVKISENMTYSFDNLNEAPLINAQDRKIMLGSKFNPMEGVSGYDKEDGDITSDIKVVDNKVVDKVGTWTVTYSLTDSFGATVTKTINVTVMDYEEKNSLFMYNSLKWQHDNIFNISGFLGVRGIDNKSVSHSLIFVNQVTNKEYVYKLDNWQNYPYEMSSIDDTKKYDYSGGWFNSNLDLTLLPSGDYTIYVKALNGKYQTKTLFTNIAYMPMDRNVSNKNRGYRVEIDFSTSGSPLVFSVRDNGLLSNDVSPTIDPMYNFFTKIKFQDKYLHIRGTSHNYGVDLSPSKNVQRELILENNETFERYIYDIGSITNGDYKVTLALSDNCDKTRAWYDNKIDLSSVKAGTYTLYIRNTVDGKKYYGELIDIAWTDFAKINTNLYSLQRVDKRRLRVELIVK